MKRMWILSFLVAMSWAAGLVAQESPQQELKVSQMAFCLQIVDREPVGEATSFADTTSKVYCFTKIEGAESETEITHKWYYGDKLMAEVSLPVRSAVWRTNSSKRLVKSWVGEWRVDVVDAEGSVLRSASFTVNAAD